MFHIHFIIFYLLTVYLDLTQYQYLLDFLEFEFSRISVFTNLLDSS